MEYKHCTVLSRNIVMENPDSPFRYFGWPSVSRSKDGTMFAVASGFRLGHVCPFGKAVMSVSNDNGETWSRPAPVIDTLLDDRDAGIVAYGDNDLLITSFTNTMEFQRWWTGMRKDNVTRMTDPHQIDFESAEIKFIDAYTAYADVFGGENKYYGSTYRLSHDNGKTWGPIRLAPISSPHGPAVTSDGKLIYIGRTFADMVHKAEVEAIECYEMDGNGRMEKLGTVPPYQDGKGDILNCEPHAVILPDGKIIVHIRVQRNGENFLYGTAQSVSLDGGHTFTEPKLLLTSVTGAPAHLLCLSSGVLISSVGRREKPYGIRILVSYDRGETWEDRILTDDAPQADLGYPATVELPDGTLYTVFYQNNGDDAFAYQNKGDTSRIYGIHWILD